jgi:hypothetical protein
MRRLALVLALLGGACGPTRPLHPVVVVGIDGLEPTVVAKLLAEGRLPNLARFAREGVIGRLGSMVPTWSPVLWTTIATGQEPEAHGIDFFQDPEGRPYTSNARRVPALWNLASDLGLSVDCVGWWNTWPAEPIEGRMLSSYAAQAQAQLIWKPGVWDSLEEQTWPPGLASELRPYMVFVSDAAAVREKLFDAFPRPGALDPVTGKSVTDLGWTYAADLTSAAVAAHLLETGPADLTLAYLALPDVAGHRFWKFHEPDAFRFEVSRDERASFGEYVEVAHVEADRLLGEILASAPPTADVIVLSDHGMHANPDALDDPVTGSTGHHQGGAPGVVALRGPLVTRRGNLLASEDRALGHVLEIAPLVLHLLGAEVPGHWPAVLDGRLELEELLDPAWVASHPMMFGPDRDAGFRPATPSRLPAEDVDRAFQESFSALGYVLGREPDEPRDSETDAAGADADPRRP